MAWPETQRPSETLYTTTRPFWDQMPPCRKVKTMKHPLVVSALIAAVALSGCASRSMVKRNRENHLYTTGALLAEYPWLKDVAANWRTTVDLSASELPGYDDLGAYPLGNGRVFGINGLLPPLGAVRNLTGPGYQKQAGFYGAVVPAVSVRGELRALPRQSVEWVRKAGVVHTVQQDEAMALHIYDWVAPAADIWCRLVIAENTGREDLADVKLVMASNSPSSGTGDGRLVSERGNSRMTLGVIGAAKAETDGLHLPLPETVYGYQQVSGPAGIAHLTCPVGKIAPAQSAGKLFYLVFEDVKTPTQAEQTAAGLAEQGLAALAEAYESNRAWHEQGLCLGTMSERVNDFIEIQKHIVRCQQHENGGFSPMDKYTFTWVRDSVGPVRFFTQMGYPQEVAGYLRYTYAGNAHAREIRLNLPLDIPGPFEAIEDANWSEYPVERAEVPSYIVLHHWWYYLQTADLGLLEDHYEYLKRCIFGQQLSERGTLPFHGDETYRFPGYCAYRQGFDVHDYVQLETQSADSAFEFVAAAEAMAQLAELLGRDEDVTAFADIATRVRKATEEHFWMPDRGYYAPAASDFTAEQHRYPFASINMRPLWIGYAGVDDQQRQNVLNALKYLWKKGGGVNVTPDFGYYTTMVPGFVLYNLNRIHHQDAQKWVLRVLDAAETSGGFAEMNTPRDRPAESIWGQHRCRPWEGGINAHAIIDAILGPEYDATQNRLKLAPAIGSDERALGATNIAAGETKVDLTAYSSTGRRTYELTAHSSDGPPTLDLRIRVPARTVHRIGGNYEAFGGHVADQTTDADGWAAVEITDIAMEPDEAVTVEIEFDQYDPPVEGVGSETFVYGPAEVTGRPSTLLLTWNPEVHERYRQKLGGELMALDTKIPWPLDYLRGVLLPEAGKIGPRTVLLDVETYPGGFRDTTYWTTGAGGKLIEGYKALGGMVEKAEGATELPPSYRNMERETR